MEVRTSIEEDPVATALVAVPDTFDAATLDTQMSKVANELVKAMVGSTAPGGPGIPQPPPPPVFVP